MSENINSLREVTPIEPGCTRCAFAVPVVAQGEIVRRWQCRCAPPTPIPAVIQGNAIGSKLSFPVVTDADWCYQFTPRVQSN